MSLRTMLRDLATVVSDEAERNPEFAKRLEAVFRRIVPAPRTRPTPMRKVAKPRRPTNRRQPAVLDPVEMAAQDENRLHSALSELTLDQLKDIVADHGMDQDKLVMKWRNPQRVIDRIVEMSVRRAHKGDAFRL